MDHQKIKEEEVVVRYVLGKLSPEEEGRFEEHYFACGQCFHEVQETEMIATAIKQGTESNELGFKRLRGRRKFRLPDLLRFPAYSPAAAVVISVLLLLLVYPAWRGIVMVPRLGSKIERLSEPQPNIRSFSLQQTRGGGEGQVSRIEVGPEEKVFILNFNILEQTIPHPEYEALILDSQGKRIWEGKGLVGGGAYEVFSIACNISFLQEGRYMLRVFEIDPETGEVTKNFPFPFEVVVKEGS